MEKETLTAGGISKKLVWEYLLLSFIFGFLEDFILAIFLMLIPNFIVNLIVFAIVNFIIVYIYFRATSKSITEKYVIKNEDISKIIRNISIFFVIATILTTIADYNDVKEGIEEQAKFQSIFMEVDKEEYLEEVFNQDEDNRNYQEAFLKVKDRQEEEYKDKLTEIYNVVFIVLTVYNIGVFAIMISLQRKWLLKVAE